ncbi:ABC transporter ATP-binding protein [Aquabacterium sp. J223]|uniref:ABC transporter ATP-binding protein n=1 Tax=Aquabacterium sp. J223 TaxID=2898431 RepID=UPI0021AD9775|nr:ABC transporter ATP-binding protein [Aquabacterium sp. J223]UUX96461.1 ABC transporter ATP-binding protein [Aquabacterium sp. J223]
MATREAPSGEGVAPGVLEIAGLCKRFGPTVAVDDVNLSVAPGEVLAVTGPSGAGKSTLARLLSGLERPDAGRIALAGQRIDGWPARSRRVAHMFESYALYPTRSVAQNIASPLLAPTSGGRWDAAQRAARIDEVLALTEMSALRDRMPSQLSGGQKQRVALCRALVQAPSLFVLDEPIGHLDARLRHSLRAALRRRQRRQPQATLWFTPDGIEALAVADRVAVLIEGRLQQVGTPDEVVARPANVRVARLIGDPAMNIVPLDFVEGLPGQVRLAGGPPQPASAALHGRFAGALAGGGLLGLRPTALRPLPPDAAPADALHGEVYAVEPLGKHTLLTVAVGTVRVKAKLPGLVSWAIGQRVALAFDPQGALGFSAGTGDLVVHDGAPFAVPLAAV